MDRKHTVICFHEQLHLFLCVCIVENERLRDLETPSLILVFSGVITNLGLCPHQLQFSECIFKFHSPWHMDKYT